MVSGRPTCPEKREGNFRTVIKSVYEGKKVKYPLRIIGDEIEFGGLFRRRKKRGG